MQEKVVKLCSINIILQMEISHILGRSLSAGRTPLLSSIIEPDQPQNKSQNQFIIKKVPLAHKILVQDYHVRATISHPNIPILNIDSNSKFYLTIYAQKTKPFSIKDLLMISFQARNKLLLDLLNTVNFLSQQFGYFYVTQKMVGYDLQGRVKIWINDDVLQNRRKYPINHGSLSQQLFVTDFKQYFGDYFRTLREFHEAKNINSLTKLLEKSQSIYQSIHLSEPIEKGSFILRNKEITTSYDGQIFSKIINQSEVMKPTSPNNHTLDSVLKRQISISFLPVNQSQVVAQTPKKLMRMQSNPINFRHSINTSQSNLVNFDAKSSIHQSLLSSSSSGNLARTNVLSQSTIPKIQFNYSLHKQAWKKKKRYQAKKSITIEPVNNLTRSTSANNLYQNSFKESFHETLKVSFPHTTTHTFTPFASNGNISLHFNESIVEKKEVPVVKQQLILNTPGFQQHISEQSNEVEMDLDCLFSDSGNDLHSRQQMENLEILVQQFQNILLA